MTQRHDNIAKSLQVVTEEIILHLLKRLHAKTRCERLCMTGGVAMNSVANGKITSQTPFKEVYIPAGAADNGTAFGAAFYVWNKLLVLFPRLISGLSGKRCQTPKVRKSICDGLRLLRACRCCGER